jgi:hypothetical protein
MLNSSLGHCYIRIVRRPIAVRVATIHMDVAGILKSTLLEVIIVISLEKTRAILIQGGTKYVVLAALDWAASSFPKQLIQRLLFM